MIINQYLNKINFSKLGLLIILGFGWMEKIFVWEGVPEGIFKMVETNILTSWLTKLGANGSKLFFRVF